MKTIILSTSKHVHFTFLGYEGRKIAVVFWDQGRNTRDATENFLHMSRRALWIRVMAALNWFVNSGRMERERENKLHQNINRFKE